MDSQSDVSATTAAALWRRNGLVWFALLVLLMLSFGCAYLPIGSAKTVLGPLIAAIKALIVATLFMELGWSKPLLRLTAAVGFVFVAVLCCLALTDVLARFTP